MKPYKIYWEKSDSVKLPSGFIENIYSIRTSKYTGEILEYSKAEPYEVLKNRIPIFNDGFHGVEQDDCRVSLIDVKFKGKRRYGYDALYNKLIVFLRDDLLTDMFKNDD